MFMIIGVSCFLSGINAQDEGYVEIKGKLLTMPVQINKSYGAWTSVETKAKLNPSELGYRLKDKEKMVSALEFEKDPKLFLQKANVVLLKAKNASLGITLYYYSYTEIPNYLSLSVKEVYNLWMSRLKSNPKTLKKLTRDDYNNYEASIGEGIIDGKPLSFYFYTSFTDVGTNQVILYSVSKQNADKCVMFFGETFGMDWATGEYLEGGH